MLWNPEITTFGYALKTQKSHHWPSHPQRQSFEQAPLEPGVGLHRHSILSSCCHFFDLFTRYISGFKLSQFSGTLRIATRSTHAIYLKNQMKYKLEILVKKRILRLIWQYEGGLIGIRRTSSKMARGIWKSCAIVGSGNRSNEILGSQLGSASCKRKHGTQQLDKARQIWTADFMQYFWCNMQSSFNC